MPPEYLGQSMNFSANPRIDSLFLKSWLVGWVLWYIKLWKLFNAKSILDK